jgi:hypothetical protein
VASASGEKHRRGHRRARLPSYAVAHPRVTYLTLRNESDLSISAVRAVAEGVANNGLEYVDLLQPGKDRDFFMSGIGDSFTVCAAEFDDAAGRTWIRTADGALHRTHRLGGTALRLNLTRDNGAQIVNKIGMYPGPGPGRRAVWLSVKSLSEQPCVTTWRDTPRRRLPRQYIELRTEDQACSRRRR